MKLRLNTRSCKIRRNISQVNVVETPFFLSYALMIMYMILCSSFYAIHIVSSWKIVFVFCIGLLIIYELIKNGLTWKNIITISAILLLIINILRISQGLEQNSIALILLYIFCARDIYFKKIAKCTIIISVLTILFVIISSFAGIITNYVSPDQRHREYLGFLYALNGPTIFSNVSMLWLYVKKEKITVKETLILIILNYLLFLKTNSRLCFGLTALILLVGLLLKRYSGYVLRRKIVCYMMICSFLLAAGLSFYLTTRYNSYTSWMATLNGILGNRLSLGQASIEKFGINLFGNPEIEWIGNGLNLFGEVSNKTYLYVDNYYINIAQRFGSVFLVIVLIFLLFANYKAYKEKDVYLLCIFTILAIHFIIDDLCMSIQYNTFWLAAGCLVFSRTNKKTDKERSHIGYNSPENKQYIMACFSYKL